jgi:hypothetical protein
MEKKKNEITYIKFNNSKIEYLLNNMKIKILLEILNFITKDNIKDFYILFLFFNKDTKDTKDAKDATKDTTKDYIKKMYIEQYKDDYNDILSEFDYIIFIILFRISIDNISSVSDVIINRKIDEIVDSYINNNNSKLNTYYKNIVKIYIKYYEMQYNLTKTTDEYKNKIYLETIKIIKYLFLTTYIDINNTYALYCINIYLYYMKKFTNDNKDDTININNKKREILVLLARLLLQTNTFYLNNYTNYLQINYKNDDKSLKNNESILKEITSKISFNDFIELKEKFYEDNTNCTNYKQIIFKTRTTNILFHKLFKKGGDNFTLKDPTYILHYIPMNNCKRNKLIKFIKENLK